MIREVSDSKMETSIHFFHASSTCRKMRSKFEKIHDKNDTVLLEDPIQVRKVVHDYFHEFFQSWKMCMAYDPIHYGRIMCML